MENGEKNNRDDSRREQGKGGKKPFYKHYHHRPNHHNKNDQNKESADHGGDINTGRPRYDTPPSEQQSADSFKVSENRNTEKKQDGGRDENRRPHHHRRRNGNDRRDRQQRQSDIQDAVTASAEEPAEATQDDVISKATADSHSAFEREASKRRKRHQRHHGGHGGEENTAEATVLTESSVIEAEDAAYTSAEPEYTEYITTAGSLDAEVVDELNSVSADELENMGASEDDSPASPLPEAELPKHEIVGIRFKAGGKIYYFAPGDFKCQKGEAVIVETSRGLEYGICDIPNRIVTEREVILPLRPIIRKATSEDTERHNVNTAKEQEALAICNEKILDHNLGMKLIDVEYAFDGSKLLFYFTAEGRVDFRELVKDLAAVFRTRIELRQIGIRDETKLLGGIGICGRPFCCKTFLSDFVQVSIKMAKEQNLSLNSVKISGACGRLMCCLRYEYDVYQEEIKKTPKVDQIVETPDGEGTVIEVQPLAGLVRVRFGTKADMITPKVYHRDDVKVIGGKGVKPKEQ